MEEFYKSDKALFIDWICSQWNITFHSLCENAAIQGSPERCIGRQVFRDTEGRRYLIESFNAGKHLLRLKVAQVLEYLNQNGLDQALAYKKTKEGDFLPFYHHHCYQISDFLDSTGVKQPDYLSSGKMGENFALFLKQLSQASQKIDNYFDFKPFSIKTYIYQLFDQMKIHDATIHDDFLPVLGFLEESFMECHDRLQVAFCHGDLHPLNVIWDKDEILAVIDWEFTGCKPDIYDLANLVGCAGIEDPHGLGMPMVMQCIESVQANHLFSESGWQIFPEYILALRFAWLSEWLRKKDQEMIEMENAYMKILMKNMDVLRKGWNI